MLGVSASGTKYEKGTDCCKLKQKLEILTLIDKVTPICILCLKPHIIFQAASCKRITM